MTAATLSKPAQTLGDLDPDARLEWLSQAIEEGYVESPGNRKSVPASALEDSIWDWAYNVTKGHFQRWPCDSEHCPAEPAWDKAIEETFSRMTTDIVEHAADIVRAHFMEKLTAFAEQHPEARLETELRAETATETDGPTTDSTA